MAVAWLAGQPMTVWGDTITLANGERLEGIVTRETAAEIEVQVAWQSTLAFDRSAVAAVTRSSNWDNRRLLGRWRDESTAAQRRERTRLAAEASRRAQAKRAAQAKQDDLDAQADLAEQADLALAEEATTTTAMARPPAAARPPQGLPSWMSRQMARAREFFGGRDRQQERADR